MSKAVKPYEEREEPREPTTTVVKTCVGLVTCIVNPCAKDGPGVIRRRVARATLTYAQPHIHMNVLCPPLDDHFGNLDGYSATRCIELLKRRASLQLSEGRP